jgi:hypothetical protein
MFKFGFTRENELLQGRICMLALPIMVAVYLKFGQIIPGVW